MSGVTDSSADDVNEPLEQRLKRFQWGVVPFPANSDDLGPVTYAPFDTLVIPKGARHKKEAFEFIAYVNRQDVMEKLCQMQSKNSPLQRVSRNFLEHHKNPYVQVFESLASSPGARGLPQIPIWPEFTDEMNNTIQQIMLLEQSPTQALQQAQVRMQGKYEQFMRKQRARYPSARAGGLH
jgi:multiple sugar transport system substrate-binding protein